MATMIASQAEGSLVSTIVGSIVGDFYLPGILGDILPSPTHLIDKLIMGELHHYKSNTNLQNINLQTATYGKVIPEIYGTVKLSGNIIWISPITEQKQNSASNKMSGPSSKTQYTRKVSFAIGICKGPIDSILHIYVDENEISSQNYEFYIYNGSENQIPNSLMESYLGTGNVPAYKDLCYIVFHDFPISNFGNIIPNLTFEVKKNIKDTHSNTAENLLQAITIIPGSGEFVYDTTVQTRFNGVYNGEEFIQIGSGILVNQNNNKNKADSLLSLDQLQQTLPNISWISLVVVWFGDSLDAKLCTIYPAVEFINLSTSPDSWQVADFTRYTAKEISKDESGRPNYGGTVSDVAVLRYIQEIKSRGYKIMFYPMFFLDVPGKPWRGRVTGTAQDVDNFFTKDSGYNQFIMHYANLVKDKIDAFVIGSELIGLTKVVDAKGNYPAVNQLINLASSVKNTLGNKVIVTYAADWSEYHHTDGGYYNLDKLWSSPSIDVIGIDAYMPLTNNNGSIYDIELLQNGWQSGEGFDYYYTDSSKSIKQPLSAPYAWKNIRYFWENEHYNPGGAKTSWIPRSKKIWFTEYGFPSVDCSSNQPNVFYSAHSIDGAFPINSNGNVDFMAQRKAIEGTEIFWQQNTDMVERRFLWTWDARAYPYYPDLNNIWNDGDLWQYGHWVNGKLGVSLLQDIVSDLCLKSGLTSNDFDVSDLDDIVDGIVLDKKTPIASLIATLAKVYFFGIANYNGKLTFKKLQNCKTIIIDSDNLIVDTNKPGEILTIQQMSSLSLPGKLEISYFDKINNYKISNTRYSINTDHNNIPSLIQVPIVLSEIKANNIAKAMLLNYWNTRLHYSLTLSKDYLYLMPFDIVQIAYKSLKHNILISDIAIEDDIIKVTGISIDQTVYSNLNCETREVNNNRTININGPTQIEILDLYDFNNNASTTTFPIYIAGIGVFASWKGATIYVSNDNGSTFSSIVNLTQESIMGTAMNILTPNISPALIDEESSIEIMLLGNNKELLTIDKIGLLQNKNLCLIGSEIVAFGKAEFLGPNHYKISQFLRGRFNTEGNISTHTTNETFVLLDDNLARIDLPISHIGSHFIFKAVSFSTNLNDAVPIHATLLGKGIMPFKPVHIVQKLDSSGNINITWIRRSRIEGVNWQAPLLESSENYSLNIYDNSNILKRKIENIPQNSYIYSASMQITDFGSVIDKINNIDVHQNYT